MFLMLDFLELYFTELFGEDLAPEQIVVCRGIASS